MKINIVLMKEDFQDLELIHVHDQKVDTREVETLGNGEDVALAAKNVVTTTIIASTTIRQKYKALAIIITSIKII